MDAAHAMPRIGPAILMPPPDRSGPVARRSRLANARPPLRPTRDSRRPTALTGGRAARSGRSPGAMPPARATAATGRSAPARLRSSSVGEASKRPRRFDYIYIYIYIYNNTYIYIYIYIIIIIIIINIYIYIHICIYVCVSLSLSIYIYIYVYTYDKRCLKHSFTPQIVGNKYLVQHSSGVVGCASPECLSSAAYLRLMCSCLQLESSA